jgi:hypothetical protein
MQEGKGGTVERWEVITEVGLRAKVNGWGLSAKYALYAAQERFREEGPDAFELDAPSLTGDPTWDQLSKTYVAELWIQVERTWLWVELEILPNRTVIFRRGRLE